ncbi:putative E3 ubiquitin-protein ligase TRIML1 [Sminthopsis crassicaudata]|uniref:putative E3 ubiquitin-protein ligase TRIML1 n=1 Tax=Sminthopsis crassicaudata TaxID=9301 RepID=UPI003D69267C
MDVKDLIKDLQASVTCSICLGYFTDPVTVNCGHSFCKGCLRQCRVGAQETSACPECRADINHGTDLVSNRSLQQLSIITKMLRPHLVQALVGPSTCEKHGEKEKLFCEDDHRILCHSCSLAPEHRNHCVLPLEKVAAMGKEKILEAQKFLKRKEDRLQEELDHVIRAKARCTKYALHSQNLLMSEYDKMCQLLREQENVQLLEMKEQFSHNIVKYDRQKVKLSQDIQRVKSLLLEVETHVEETPSEMVQGMKGTLDKSEKLLHQEPEVVSEDWTIFPIFCLREMLMTFFRDITLDPDTANIHLMVSEDLKSVKYTSVPQDLPYNKDRFVHLLIVLGAQTFTSASKGTFLKPKFLTRSLSYS